MATDGEANFSTYSGARLLLRNCMTKVFWLQLQYWLYGVLLGLLALGLVSLLVHMSGASWSAPIVSLLLLVIMVAMSFAAYWAYTKWLLHEPIGEFAFRLLRVRRDGN